MQTGPALAVALVVLALSAAVITQYACLGHGRAVLTASTRAVVQLALVSLVLVAVVRSLPLTLLFVLSMFAVASWTASRRITGSGGTSSGGTSSGGTGSGGTGSGGTNSGGTRSGGTGSGVSWSAALPVGLGPLPVVLGLLLAGIVPAEGIAVVPVAGILIGGAMTATALAGRRAVDELVVRRGEVEAGLAIGLLPRDAAIEVCRAVAGQALVPALDQTRTVGLVALPGAFVGTLLGGATPVEAGAVQVLILIALLAVQAVAVAVTVELVAQGTLSPRSA